MATGCSGVSMMGTFGSLREEVMTGRHVSPCDERKALALPGAWLDGEIVMLKNGLPNFSALRNAMDVHTNRDIVYFLFDLMYVDGRDMRKVSLWARRARLAEVLEHAGEHLRLSEAFDAPAAAVFEAAASLGLEGLMLKRRHAPYESGRTQSRLKAKARLRQELVVCGSTARGSKDGEIGSLQLGYYDDAGKLHDAGSVGTGWDSRTARDILGSPRPAGNPVVAVRRHRGEGTPLVAPRHRHTAVGRAPAACRSGVRGVDSGRRRAPGRVQGTAP